MSVLQTRDDIMYKIDDKFTNHLLWYSVDILHTYLKIRKKMPQHLSISQAARLVGITRSILQKHIKNGTLSTFEGKITVTELLHLYPDAQIVDNTVIERVERIKEKAVRRRVGVARATLDTEILATALTTVKKELTLVTSNVLQYQEVLQVLTEKLRMIEETDDAHLREHIVTLHNWLKNQINY